MSEEQPKAFLEAVRCDVDLPDKLKGTDDAEAVGLDSLILESGITELQLAPNLLACLQFGGISIFY